MNKKIIVFLGSCLITSVFAATVLTPNTNNNTGVIPSGHTALEFNLANANWVKDIFLPKTATNNDTIKISSSAQFDSYLDTSNTDLPVESLKVSQGESYSFRYDAAQQKWLVNVDIVYPENGLENFQVPLISQKIQHVSVKDGQWARKITLPNNVVDGTLMFLTSTAQFQTKLDTENLLFPSTYTLKNGDSFLFKYNSELKKWVPESIQPYMLNASSVGSSIKTIEAPVTQINFADANWVSSIELPTKANDRDRVIFKSVAIFDTTIQNTHTNTQATLKLKKGDRYEFMYVLDQSKWVLISSPELVIEAKDLGTQQIPDMTQPTTRIKTANANWQSVLNLPLKAQVGDKVIINSLADFNTTITAKNGLQEIIKQNETQRYIYTSTGWKSNSSTIDMLLATHPNNVSNLGETAAKLRLYEAMDLTNVAAENSNAEFYIRRVGFLTHKIPAVTDSSLLQVIRAGRDDVTLQNERKRLLADAIYYDNYTAEVGFDGLAWRNDTPSAYHMIGSGAVQAPIIVMRHEFGHNMGIDHDNSNIINQGFSHPLGCTIMGGNNTAYYSSPNLYHPKYGVRLGEVGKIDAVSMINKNAPVVSKFY